MHDPPLIRSAAFWIDPLDGEADLDGVLDVEAESFTNPWTREMYAWELQNRSVCHIYVARTPRMPRRRLLRVLARVRRDSHQQRRGAAAVPRRVAWASAIMHHVLAEARQLGARRATLEVRASNEARRRLYERLGFYVAGHTPQLLHEPGRGRADPLARRASHGSVARKYCAD